MKISQVGTGLFHADGETNMTKLLEILRTRLKMSFETFRDMTPCSLVDRYYWFGDIYCLTCQEQNLL